MKVTEVRTHGAKFGARGNAHLLVVIELEGNEQALRRARSMVDPSWAREVAKDKTHCILFGYGAHNQLTTTYEPHIEYSTTPVERWALRTLDEVVALATRYAEMLEDEARRLTPLTEHEAELMADKPSSTNIWISFRRDPRTVDIEVSASAECRRHTGVEKELVWTAPPAFNQRYRVESERFSVCGTAVVSMSEEEFMAFTKSDMSALIQKAMGELHAEAAMGRCRHLMRMNSAPSLALYVNATPACREYGRSWANVELVAMFDDDSKARRVPFADVDSLLAYMETFDAEAFKKEHGYDTSAGRVARETAEYLEEKRERAEQRKAAAEARAKLEADWKALQESARILNCQVGGGQ
jgi:hypothetical protein